MQNFGYAACSRQILKWTWENYIEMYFEETEFGILD
jgi:hypothetical protein